jgi:hypothetical protein
MPVGFSTWPSVELNASSPTWFNVIKPIATIPFTSGRSTLSFS